MFDFFGSYQFTVDVILIQVLLVMSFYVVFQCGLLSLASVGFMAVGAYTSTILVMENDWPVAGGVVAAMAVAGVVALAFGVPVLRLHGIYLALGSLALAQATVIGIANFDFTNGARGFAGIPAAVNTDHLVIAVVVVAVLFNLLHRSHFGRALRSIRLDERTAEGLGVAVLRYKSVAFALSGVLAGLAGALEAHRTRVISPDQYGFELLVVILTFAIVGGSGHWVGPILATIAISVFLEYVGTAGTTWEHLVFGSLLIAIMLIAPNGLSDRALYRPLLRRLRRDPAPSSGSGGVVSGDQEARPKEVSA